MFQEPKSSIKAEAVSTFDGFGHIPKVECVAANESDVSAGTGREFTGPGQCVASDARVYGDGRDSGGDPLYRRLIEGASVHPGLAPHTLREEKLQEQLDPCEMIVADEAIALRRSKVGRGTVFTLFLPLRGTSEG